jgi:uncharacterized membrane protein YfcA
MLYTFLHEYFLVYVWLISTTIVDMIAPLSGSSVTTPVVAYFTDPKRAIGIVSFLFAITAVYRVYVFRKEIFSDKHIMKILSLMAPISALGALGGGFFISYINPKILVVIIILISFYYILKNALRPRNASQRLSHLSMVSISLFSGFLQAAGMPGGDMKRNYLRTQISELSVRAVSSALLFVNLTIGGTILLAHSKLTATDMIFVITCAPFLCISIVYGKRILEKIPDRQAKLLASSLSFVGILLLIYKYFL